MTIQQPVLFAFGYGYSVARLGMRLLADGWQVHGTVRSPDKAACLQADGVRAHVFDTAGDIAVPDGAHWVISIPPDADGCPAYRAAAGQAANAASITYLSTTGVYGDAGGGWVTEDTAPNPASNRSKQRVLAETQWLSVRPDARIVRLPGIYGPGRSAFDRLRKGTAQRIIKQGQVFSRVHVDDIAGGVEALLARPDLSGVFHLCDDAPAPPQDVIEYAAHLAGLPVPPDVDFDAADLSAMARSFYADCKRVANATTKARLGWRPVYADYQSGLAAIWAEEKAIAKAETLA